MKSPIVPIVALLVSSIAPSAIAQTKELTPTQVESILKKLDEIQGKLDRGKEGNNARLLSAIENGLADPKAAVELFQNCVRAEVFQKDERTVTEFNEWKSRMAPLHRSKPFAVAMRAQLLFLRASIKASTAEKFETAVPAIREFTEYFYQVEPILAHPEEVDDDLGRLRGDFFGFRNESFFSNAVGRFFDIQSSAKPIEGWPDNMMSVKELYENVLNPYYRSEGKAEALIGGWDERIAALKFRAAAREKEDHIATAKDMMEKELPNLLWGRSKDLFQYGDQVLGAQEMLKVIETYLESEQSASWISEITALLNGEPDPSLVDPEADEDGETTGSTLGEALNVQ